MKEENKANQGVMKILVLLIVLAVLVCALYGLKAYNARQDAAEEEGTYEAEWTCDESDITSLHYVLDGIEYRFDRDSDDKWVYRENPELDLSQSAVEGMVQTASSIYAGQFVTENLQNAADYGLDDPQFTLTITMKDGTERILYIGNENTMSNIYYAYLEEDERIFTIEPDFYTSFTGIDNLVDSSLDESSSYSY